jgi:hypothetical protein
MKKITFLLLSIIVCINISAQKLEWIKVDDRNDDYRIRYLLKMENQTNCAVFSSQKLKPFTPIKEQHYLRSYNADFSKYSQMTIPAETPENFSIDVFRNYVVLYGYNDEMKGPFARAVTNRVIFGDILLNPLQTVEFQLQGEKSVFNGAPNLSSSFDSTNLIIESFENPYPGRPSPRTNENIIHLKVIDNALKTIWNADIDFDKIFPKGAKINKYYFDFINDKLYLIAATDGNKFKKVNPSVFIVRFDKPDSYEILHTEIFPNSLFDIQKKVVGKNQLIICGRYFNKVRGLYLLEFNLTENNPTPVKKTISFDKLFLSKNPDFKYFISLAFQRNNYDRAEIIPVDDGYLFFSEQAYVSTSTSGSGSSTRTTTNYTLGPLAFIKTDKNLNIKWYKYINRRYTSEATFYDKFCSHFRSGKDFRFFYYDFEQNIGNNVNSLNRKFFFRGNLCVTMATLSPDGEIQQTPLSTVTDTKIFGETTYMYPWSNDRYIIKGYGYTMKGYGKSYIGVIDLKN